MKRVAAVLTGLLILANVAFASLDKLDSLVVETKQAQENLNELNNKMGAQEKDLEEINMEIIGL